MADFTGTGGRFPSERVADLDWNRWLVSTGMGGTFGPEYALRAGRATVGVEQGMLRKDFLVKAMRSRGSIRVLNGRRTIRRDKPMILTRFQPCDSISPNVTHHVPL